MRFRVGGPRPQRGRSDRRVFGSSLARTWIIAGVLASGLTALVLLAVRGGPGPPFPLLLIGLDGADWEVVRPMIRDGRLPNLGRLIREGTSGTLLSEPPLLSPILWTTIATGRPPGEHGITSFVVRKRGPQGEPLPVQGTERRCPAIWNLLSGGSLRVCVVGWWATYPAEAVRGAMVSDAVGFHHFSMTGDGIGTALGKVHPPRLWSLVREEMGKASARADPEARRLTELSEEEWGEGEPSVPGSPIPDRVRQLRQMVATTRGFGAITRSLLGEVDPDFAAVYFSVTDWGGHLFARFALPPMARVSEEGRREFGATFEKTYELADDEIGRLLGEWKNGRVLIVSDHGFLTGERRPDEGDEVDLGGADSWHRPEGTIVLHGPGIERGKEIVGGRIYDVAPTALYLLGQAVPEEMPGKVLLDAVDPGVLDENPVRRVPAGECSAPGRSGSVDLDDATAAEMVRNLRSLGYVTDGTALPAGALARRAAIAERSGDARAALRDLEAAVAANPADPALRVRLARAYEEAQQPHDAQPHWEAAVRMRHEDPSLLYEVAARLPEASALQAIEMLERAERLAPLSVPIRMLLGDKRRQAGDLHGAERMFRSILETHPSEAQAWYNLGVCLARRGATAEARAAYERCLAIDDSSDRAQNNLANLMLAQGEVDGAVEAFRTVLRSDPDSFEAHYNLGTALLRREAFCEAAEHLEKATRLRPDDRGAHLNRGIALVGDRRPGEAIEVLVRTMRQFPDDTEIARLALRLLLAGGRVDEARSLHQEVAKRHPGAAREIEGLIRDAAASRRAAPDTRPSR
jgi:tetratricopeptide (TPR) repeat protein